MPDDPIPSIHIAKVRCTLIAVHNALFV